MHSSYQGENVSIQATTSCSLGSGSLLALSAGLSSFVAAAACLKSPLANKDRVPKLTMGPTGGDELDDNDPTKKLQQETSLPIKYHCGWLTIPFRYGMDIR